MSHIGQDTPRPDAAAKAAGRAAYIHDLTRPGMLYGQVVWSEHASARIVNIDTSAAERLPGVRAVITAANTPRVPFGFLRDNLALKSGVVRQFRDEVAAVAATSPEIAREAARLVKVEYEPLPGVFSPDEALAEGAWLVHETDARGRPRASNRLDLKFAHHSGDLDEARRRCAHITGGRYSTPVIQQSCMGTAGCIAELDLGGNLTMWAKTQIPFLAQRDFMDALASMGMKGRNARVIVPALGGAFGTGLDTHAYEFIAILLAHKTGRPVKMLYDRDEEFAYLSPRQSAIVDVEEGCDARGNLVFRKVHVTQDNGAYTSWGATFPSVMLIPATSLYRVPVVHFDSTLVYTNNTYCQAMRGYGNPEVTWAIECNLDRLAEQAGIDPLEIRRINCNQPGETTPMGLKVSTCGLRECLDAVASRLDWDNKRGQQKGKKRGVGLASLVHVGGSGRIYKSDASGIILRLDDFGNVYVYSGGVEMGQGLHTALTATVAEAVGVRPDQVFINQTDTSTCPWDVGTHASRGAFTSCNAAIIAASRLRDRIFELAGTVWPDQVKPEHLDLVDGMLTIAPGELVPLEKLLRAVHFRAHGEMLSAEAFYDPPSELPDWDKGMGNMSATYAFGVQGVEVEVDEETGSVKILKMVAAHDVGRVLNQQTLEGQTFGALAQGLGYAMFEEVKTDRGRILNPNFTDYKIATAAELDFPIELVFVETSDGYGPFGAKGVGEPGLVPTAPAIANAIYDAVGCSPADLPMTPERVLEALDGRA